MPVYEFKCKKCGNDFEELCSSGELGIVLCPKCHSPETRKKISLFGFSTGTKTVAGSRGTSSCSSCNRGSCASCK